MVDSAGDAVNLDVVRLGQIVQRLSLRAAGVSRRAGELRRRGLGPSGPDLPARSRLKLCRPASPARACVGRGVRRASLLGRGVDLGPRPRVRLFSRVLAGPAGNTREHRFRICDSSSHRLELSIQLVLRVVLHDRVFLGARLDVDHRAGRARAATDLDAVTRRLSRGRPRRHRHGDDPAVRRRAHPRRSRTRGGRDTVTHREAWLGGWIRARGSTRSRRRLGLALAFADAFGVPRSRW